MSADHADVVNVAVALRAPIEADLHVLGSGLPSVVVHVGDRISVRVDSAEAARSVAEVFEAAAVELEKAATQLVTEALQ